MPDPDDFFEFIRRDIREQAQHAMDRLRSYPLTDGTTIFYASGEPIPIQPDPDGIYRITDLQEPVHDPESANPGRPLPPGLAG